MLDALESYIKQEITESIRLLIELDIRNDAIAIECHQVKIRVLEDVQEFIELQRSN